MTTQYIVLKGLPAGLTFSSGKLFTIEAADTVVTGNTFGFTNRTNANTQYVVEITRATVLPAGDYTFIAYIGSDPKAEIAVRFAGTDSETATPQTAGLDSATLDAIAEIHEGLFPDDPDTSPVVITPGTAEFMTVWFRCYSQLGLPIGGVVVKYKTHLPPDGQSGFGFQSELTTVTSADNGLVQIAGIPLGCNLAIYSGTPATKKTYQIPSAAGDGTYALPSLIV